MSSNARQLAANLPREGGLSNRNMVVNGSFKVSQRGDYTSATTVTTNYGFLVDRWVAYGNFGSEFTNANNTAKLEATTSATNRMFLRTKLEAQDILGSTTYTLSFFVTTNSASFGVHINDNSGTVDTSVISVSSGVRTKVTVTFDTPSSVNAALEIAIGVFALGRTNTSITTGEYFTLEEVQLEVGDTATPFEHRSYGDELARCQRYFYRLAKGNASSRVYVGHGDIYSNQQVNMNISPPVTFRATPALTASGSSGDFGSYTGSSAVTLTGTWNLFISSPTAQTVYMGGQSVSAGNGARIYIPSGKSSVYFDLDAEL